MSKLRGLTQSELKALLRYDRDTGIWTWVVSRGCVGGGGMAGTVNKAGYLRIKISREFSPGSLLGVALHDRRVAASGSRSSGLRSRKHPME